MERSAEVRIKRARALMAEAHAVLNDEQTPEVALIADELHDLADRLGGERRTEEQPTVAGEPYQPSEPRTASEPSDASAIVYGPTWDVLRLVNAVVAELRTNMPFRVIELSAGYAIKREFVA